MIVAKKCDGALEEIVQNSTEVRSMSGDIASSSKEQENGISMLETVVLQLKQTASQNATSSASYTILMVSLVWSPFYFSKGTLADCSCRQN